jgi:hypothetical protein
MGAWEPRRKRSICYLGGRILEAATALASFYVDVLFVRERADWLVRKEKMRLAFTYVLRRPFALQRRDALGGDGRRDGVSRDARGLL